MLLLVAVGAKVSAALNWRRLVCTHNHRWLIAYLGISGSCGIFGKPLF